MKSRTFSTHELFSVICTYAQRLDKEKLHSPTSTRTQSEFIVIARVSII